MLNLFGELLHAQQPTTADYSQWSANSFEASPVRLREESSPSATNTISQILVTQNSLFNFLLNWQNQKFSFQLQKRIHQKTQKKSILEFLYIHTPGTLQAGFNIIKQYTTYKIHHIQQTSLKEGENTNFVSSSVAFPINS